MLKGRSLMKLLKGCLALTRAEVTLKRVHFQDGTSWNAE